MSTIFLILIAIFILVGCIIGFKKFKGNIFLKIVLGFICGFIVIWLLWLMIMIFGVGPYMKNM